MNTESVSENKTGPKDILNAISADRWKEIAKWVLNSGIIEWGFSY